MPAATQYVPNIAVDAVIDALGVFAQPFIGDAEIIRGQQNRTPPPADAFLKLQEVGMTDLETPTFSTDTVNQQIALLTPTQIDVQMDFYGVNSADQCKAVKAVFRSEYAPAQFPDGIKPLYCSNGTQGNLVTGEEQYEDRWTLTASLQYNPLVYVPQQSATELSLALVKEV